MPRRPTRYCRTAHIEPARPLLSPHRPDWGRRVKHRRLEREVAGSDMTGTEADEGRLFGRAEIFRPWAPCAEAAAGRGVDSGGELTADAFVCCFLPGGAGVWLGHRI